MEFAAAVAAFLSPLRVGSAGDAETFRLTCGSQKTSAVLTDKSIRS
jgi:hypothetical protein